MDAPLQEFLRTGAFDFARLRRLRQEGRLDQVIAFDRLDPEPAPDDWQLRDEMAERLLALRDEGAPLLVLSGAFHARLDVAEGTTMAAHLARALPGLGPAMPDYAEGHCI